MRGPASRLDLLIGPDGDDPIAADGDGLRNREALVDGDDLAVRQDDIRRRLLSWARRPAIPHPGRAPGRQRSGSLDANVRRCRTAEMRLPSHVSSSRYGCVNLWLDLLDKTLVLRHNLVCL